FTAWVISVALSVPITRLQKAGLARGYAIVTTIAGFLLGITLFISLILPPIITQFINLAESLPQAAEETVIAYENFYQAAEPVQQFLPEFTLDDYNDLLDPDEDISVVEDDTPSINLGTLAGSALPILGGIGSFVGDFIANLLLIVFLTLYFILDPLPYYRGILALVPPESKARAVKIMNEIRRIIKAWLGALVVSITAQATFVSFLLGMVLGIPNALALGLMAGVSNIVPNIGFYLALIPVILFTAADDPAKLPFAIVLYIAAGEFEGKVLSPRIVQGQLALPAGLVLVFQLIAAAYLGFFGILLAVPLLAIFVALVRELYIDNSIGAAGDSYELREEEDGRLHLIHPEHGDTTNTTTHIDSNGEQQPT
ncbi:MAG: AI-2E family transporter, partial [Anaerolineales bacterium]